jgi:hypothetical protein
MAMHGVFRHCIPGVIEQQYLQLHLLVINIAFCCILATKCEEFQWALETPATSLLLPSLAGGGAACASSVATLQQQQQRLQQQQ